MKNKKIIITAFKVAVTVLLISIIFRQADWNEILSSLKQSNPFFISIVLICMIANISISALKWRILLKLHGIVYSFFELQRFYFTAVFFNNFLPTNIGGDAYRIYRTMDNERSKTGAVLAVFTERFTGILALLILGFAAAMFLWTRNLDAQLESKSIILLFGALIAGGFATIALGYFAGKMLSKKGRLPWKLKTFAEHVKDYLRNPKEVLYILAISFFFHFFTAFWMTLLARAIGPSFSPLNLIVVLAVTNVVAMLPISINGIGLMDGSFIYVASRLGMQYEQALMVMLLNRALLIPLSLIGAIYYAKDKARIKSITAYPLKEQPDKG